MSWVAAVGEASANKHRHLATYACNLDTLAFFSICVLWIPEPKPSSLADRD